MAMLRSSLITLILAGLAVGGVAQTTVPAAPTTQQMPKPQDVMKYIPSGVMAVVVVKDVRQTTDKIDKFLADAGVAQFLASQMPKGTLNLITTATMMGEGFNPNGGFAAVMLDPAPYGVSLMDLAKADENEESAATAPTTAKAPKKLPFVIFVPGKDVKSVFMNYQMSESGKNTKVALRMGDVYATTVEGYVIISPIEKALDDVVAASKKLNDRTPLGGDLNSVQMETMNGSAFAVYVNMKIAGPVAMEGLQMAEKKMNSATGIHSPLGSIAPMLPTYREMIGQMQGLVIAGKVEATGLAFDLTISWDPASEYGKLVQEQKGSSSTFVDRLPNLPYFMAAGQEIVITKYATDMMAKNMDILLGEAPFKSVPDADKDRLKKLVMDVYGELTGLQLAAGGAPEGVKGIGVAAVLQCKDADKFKALISEASMLTQAILRDTAGEDEKMKQVTVAYTKDAEKSGDVSVDVIEVTHADLATAGEDMAKIVGEDKLRIRVASADKNMVVMTFGGGTLMMDTALKASKGKGSIPSEPGTVEAMAFMPSSRNGMVLYNIGNLFDVVKRFNEEAPIPFQIRSKTPIALGMGVSGSTQQINLYIPTTIVKDITGILGMMGGGMMPPPETEEKGTTTGPATNF